MGANFTPTFGAYSPLTPFRYWCQKVLPLVYDDSLSYYECLNKTVDYLNKTMEDVETLHGDTEAMLAAFNQLQTYVNTYFDELDLTEEVQTVLDRMAENGSLDALLRPLVGERIGDVVAEQIDDAVAGQIYATVAGQINSTVINVLNGSTVVQNSVEGWLNTHIPIGDIVVDNTLSISGAAADSAAVGNIVGNQFSIENNYTKGEYVLYSGVLYRFTADHAAGGWTGTDVTAVKIGSDITDLRSALNQAIDAVFVDETAYPSVYRAGYIKEDGIFGDSSTICRTPLMPLLTEYVTITFKTGYKGKIAEYENGMASSSFVRFIKRAISGGSTSFTADTNKFYACDIFAEDGTAVTPSTIPSDAVTITYHYPTDKTLTLSGKPADGEIVGQKINGIENKLTVSKTYSSDLWEQGSITASTGNNTASTTTIRTIGKIPVSDGMEKIVSENGFEFNVFGWNGSVYLGYWNGSEFKTSGSALSYYATERDISPMHDFGVTHVRIVIRKTSGEVTTPSDAVNFYSAWSLPLKNHSDIGGIKNTLNLKNSSYNHGEYITKKEDYSDYYTGQQSDYSAFGDSTTYSEVLGAFDTLMNNSSGYITKNALGTASGTDSGGNSYTIYEYVFKPKQETSPYSDKKTPKIFMDGSIHGFEKNSTYGLYYFLKDVVEKWVNVRPLEGIRNSVELHIIPVVNPWGFDRNEYVNGNGVNINRNFEHPGEWTVVTTPDTEVNGLSAFDQPESAIIRDWLLAEEDDILMYFNCHTNGRVTTGYNEMNPLMTSNDRNDQYFNKLFDAFIRQINRQTVRLPSMYPSIQPSASELCGTITSSPTANATKGTASSWADTMQNMLAMTLEVFNGLRNSNSVTIIPTYSDDAKKICSEIIGNVVINVLLEYSMI